jgi:hypothetical protein
MTTWPIYDISEFEGAGENVLYIPATVLRGTPWRSSIKKYRITGWHDATRVFSELNGVHG